LNRFLFDPDEIQPWDSVDNTTSSAAPTVILPKDDYRTIHAASTLKLQNGDRIRAGIVGCEQSAGQSTDQAVIEWMPESPVKKPEVLKNGKPPGSLRIQLYNLTTTCQQTQIPVSLILALPRPLQIGRILPMVSQLGVDTLVLTSARKVPKDYFGSHLFRRQEQLREKLIEGLCQAGDVQLPKLKVVKHLPHFLEDNLEAMFPRDKYARVIAHPQRNNSTTIPLRMNQVVFPSHTDDKPARMVIAVGPEGGWSEPEELDMFETLGFQQVTMGTRTLRTDCAVVGLLTLGHELCYHKNNEA
jgi:RsmE family RNA methyltransferase